MRRGAGVSLDMTTSAPTSTEHPTGGMFKRPLGKTGLRVAEIGYGAWGIGADAWKGGQDDESLMALRR